MTQQTRFFPALSTAVASVGVESSFYLSPLSLSLFCLSLSLSPKIFQSQLSRGFKEFKDTRFPLRARHPPDCNSWVDCPSCSLIVNEQNVSNHKWEFCVREVFCGPQHFPFSAAMSVAFESGCIPLPNRFLLRQFPTWVRKCRSFLARLVLGAAFNFQAAVLGVSFAFFLQRNS